MPRLDHETATEREHSRHELMRECQRLRHALASANSRVRRYRALYREESRARLETYGRGIDARIAAMLACTRRCPFRRAPAGASQEARP
jgi:hypothetical protein